MHRILSRAALRPRIHIDLSRCPGELRAGIEATMAEFPARLAHRSPPRRVAAGKTTVRTVSFEKSPGQRGPSLAVDRRDGEATIRYRRPIDAFRALGIVLGEPGPAGRAHFEETAKFDMIGGMIDVSRNAVFTPETVRSLLVRFALMGVNTFLLYAEDTYEVPGEPFFGYLRGRYSRREMSALDKFADALGIEMFPCIQTLGHLGQFLQWPASAGYRDTADVLLAGDVRTGALLEKMIAAATAPFRSKRIHLGMDEAHGIGSGQYRRIHGEVRPFDILNAHLARVLAICKKRGLSPMIWSDMYFRLGSRTNNYYDPATVIPKDVVKKIPRGVQLVYWDYYHTDRAFYEDWIDRHRALGSEPVMAGGVWTWNRLWCDLPLTVATTDACLSACKAKGLKEVFATMWGDDGAECDIFSLLPGMQYFAEHGYQDRIVEKRLAANFRGSCAADWGDWVKAGGLDKVPGLTGGTGPDITNATKVLLFQDPFLPLFDPQVEGLPLRKHYAKLARELAAAAVGKGPEAKRLALPALIARAVSLKVDLRKNLARACAAGNRAKVRKILHGDLAELRRAVDRLWLMHRKLWLSQSKPFGLEVIERRYGGLRARLESLDERLRDYLTGRIDRIPELEARLERLYDRGRYLPVTGYLRAATPSTIK